MAEEVDPTGAAPGGCESSNSGDTGVACRYSDRPDYVVTRDMDLSPGRLIVCRAEAIGWIKTSIIERRTADTHLVS
eukprot:7731354-Pyramimonas_sp.AAC.1